jgi:SAM-dependent methyltransferase
MDLGLQPPSNRFLRPGESSAERHPLVLGQCATCALLQLVRPMPVEMVKPRFDWLTYNEPEGHLDRLVERLVGLPELTPQASILGITYKDDSTLKRFNRLGFERTRRLDPGADLGIADGRASLETIQGVLTPARAEALAEKHGRADLVVVRHILEHAHDPAAFLQACARLARPGGWMVFEMPDSRKFLDAGDQCFLWEEHIAYFTPATLRGHCARNGFANVEIILDPYPLEDSLIGLVKNERGEPAPAPTDADEIARARRFRTLADERRSAWRAALARLGAEGRRVAVFGAGHLAAKFISFNGVADLIECVIDDNPHKQRLRMPGSGLPIVGSAALADVDLCLLSLSPESEQRVLEAKKEFRARGGEFRSIFALSPIGMRAAA